MISLPGRVPALIAAFAHAVVTEYRKLDQPQEAAPAELSCTQARVETRWQPQQHHPAAARAGFRIPQDEQAPGSASEEPG